MSQVTKFENTKRKLDWKQEENLRESKKKDRKRRDSRILGREAKTVGEDD